MKHNDETADAIYGVMAEFESPQALVDAARETVSAGYTKAEGYSPIPIEELNDILHKTRTRLPRLILMGGLTGMASGFLLQWWCSVIGYPYMVGGRPLASWPAFIVPSYELTILFSALTAAIGMLLANGLPSPYHPVFNVPRFSLASTDKFFLVIESADPQFDRQETSRFLERTGAKGVYDVEE